MQSCIHKMEETSEMFQFT